MAQDLNTRIVVRLEDRTRTGVQSTRKGLDSVSGSFKRLTSHATAALSSLVLVGGALETLRRGAAAAVRAHADIETGLVGVAKTADLTDAQLARLDKRLAALSVTAEVGQTRGALLSIAQAAGQLGVTGVDNIALFTATIAKLEGATDLVGAEAATALARILNVTGEGIDTVDRLGSVIARLGNDFAAQESEIVHAATRMATTLSSGFGVTAAEAVALGTAVRDLGLRTELAGTGIGRAFAKIAEAARKEGSAAARQLERAVGQSLDRIQDRIAGGDTLGVFLDFLDGVRDAGADGIDILAALDLAAIESTQVLGTLSANGDRLREILAAANDEQEKNTALTEEAIRASKTFARQMQLVGNEINNSAADLGGALAPALLAVAQHWEALGVVAAAVAARLGVAGTQRAAAIVREVAAERQATIARRARYVELAALGKLESAQAVAAAQAEVVRARNAQAALQAERALGQVRLQTIGQRQALQARELAAQVAVTAATRDLAAARRADAAATSIQTQAQGLHNASLSRTRLLMRGVTGAIRLLGGPLNALITLLTTAASAWFIFGRAAKSATEDADKTVRERLRSMIEANRPPNEQLAADVKAVQAQYDRAVQRVAAAENVLANSQARAGRGVEARDQARRDLQTAYEEAQEIAALLRDVEAASARVAATATAGDSPAGTGVAPDAVTAGANPLAQYRIDLAGQQAALAGPYEAALHAAEAWRAEQTRTLSALATHAHEVQELGAVVDEVYRRKIIAAEQARADEEARIREAAHASELAAEQAHIERRQELLENAATARAAVERQLQSGRDALATPWERATAAIDRWEAAARQAVERQREASAALSRDGPEGARNEAVAVAEERLTEIARIAAARRTAAAESEAQGRLRASRRWRDGARRAFETYADAATNAARIAEETITKGLRGMEDGLTRFVATGKLSIESLADSIIASFARIAVQQSITGPLSTALGSLFAGGGGGLPPPLVSGRPQHTGGIAGALDGVRRTVPAAAFAGASRLHAGGVPGLRPNEIPTIIEHGEGVFTPEQMRALSPAAPEVTVNVINQGTGQRVVEQRPPRIDGRRLILDVVVEDIAAGGRIPRLLSAQGAG